MIRDATSASRLLHRMILAAAASSLAIATSTGAQVSTTYSSSYQRGPYNWKFREHFPRANALINAAEFHRSSLYGSLLTGKPDNTSAADSRQYERISARLFIDPPRLPARNPAEPFRRLVPEATAILEWATQFQRQIFDVWSDTSLPIAEKDGRMVELVGHYRTRPDLALSALPKSMDAVDAQIYSGSFRRKYARLNALTWGTQWLQAGMVETLVRTSETGQRRTAMDTVARRFGAMLDTPLDKMPYLMPLTPAVAPTFARRYPGAAAILDNAHMFENVIADILTSPEIPPSARRKEILRAGADFRSDTAHAISYDAWFAMTEIMGLNNMGGSPFAAGAQQPPSVPRGASMAGLMQASTVQPPMQHDAMTQGGAPAVDLAALLAIYERMMADPVIRERVATDPMLQGMIRAAFGQAGTNTPGMGGMNMPGMNMPAMSGMNMPGMNAAGSAEDRQRAVEFVVRLLSDPAVSNKIQNDPELRRLWADPDVQRRLRELRSGAVAQPGRNPAPPPAPAPAPAHKH
jgi:hypothetical protein